MTRIAFASFVDERGLEIDYVFEDEKLLRAPLAVRGIQVSTVAWDSPDADWPSYDAVIVRSTWDYHHRWSQFDAWLATLERARVRVLNPVPMLRWNIDKRYLGTLGELGIRTLPTVFVQAGSSASLAQITASHGWSQVVVKPTISAGGDNTWRFHAHEAASVQPRFDEQVQRQTVMVQQFAECISAGEWSFLFFNGLYSHAVIKVPAAGEMFVHAHRGGTTSSITPSTAQIGQASQIVHAVSRSLRAVPLYARVDMVEVDGALTLMELELVEPYLYMPYADAHAADRFADAIAQQVRLC